MLLALAVVLITVGGVAIYAGAGGFNNESGYAVIESCCAVDADIVPLGDSINAGGWACNQCFPWPGTLWFSGPCFFNVEPNNCGTALAGFRCNC